MEAELKAVAKLLGEIAKNQEKILSEQAEAKKDEDLCIPKQPIFYKKELFDLLALNEGKLYRIRKKGHLLNVPGWNVIACPRSEVVRFVTVRKEAVAS